MPGRRVVITRSARDGPERRTVYERDVRDRDGSEFEYWEIEEVRTRSDGWREVGRQHVTEPAVVIEAAAPGAARPADD